MSETNGTSRNAYVDWLRAMSLLVVVLWHWAFTILRWEPGGLEASNPLGFSSGLWIFTWLLQVMPLFFYVGGFVHLRSWERASARGEGIGPFVWRRIRALMVPGLALVSVWLMLGLVLRTVFDAHWIMMAVLLVISPLWFLAVYMMLIALLPMALWLHKRYDILVLVWLGGGAMCVDILRFRLGLEGLGWVNMVLVWGLAFQAGFFYDRISAAARKWDLALLWAGLFGLIGLVFSGLYPGSMVGVPGDKMSNMAPPTFVMVMLLAFQVGFVEVLRPTMERMLDRRRWRRVNEVVNRFALPLFLFHTTGMAMAKVAAWWLLGIGMEAGARPDLAWWLERPLAVGGALLFTLPVIALFGQRWVRRPEARAAT